MIRQPNVYIKYVKFFIAFLCIIGLSIPAAANEYKTIIKNGVNIRSTPSKQSKILWEVFQGFPLQVIARKGQWSRIVDFEGDQGWIDSSLLSNEKRVIVKSPTVNMRSGAGLNYKIVATVKYGVVLIPISTINDWIQVKHVDGATGWLNQSFIWPPTSINAKIKDRKK